MTDSTVTAKQSLKPDHMTMEEWVESRIARFEGRKYDWNALKFQADFDPKYRRAQMRYIGTGATGVASDTNTVPAEHFTFSTMVLPSKCEGPLHLHDDVEEVFFMLKGQITLMIQDGDSYTETVLRERDLISVPPGIYRGLFNHGEEEALMCVMLDRAGVEQTVLVGHSLGALVAAAFAAKYPQRVLYLVLADVAQGYGQAEVAQRENVWLGRQQQIAQGGEAMAQGRAAKLLRPGAREADVATVAAGMRRLRRDGYLAAAWMLAHDDIHRWLADYRGRLSVWCGEQDAITQPELVQGVALRYGAPYIAIPQAGHASYLDNEIFFNQQLLRIGEEVRDECTN